MAEDSDAMIERLKVICLRILSPVKAADATTIAKKDFLFTAKKAINGSELPRPYFLYFLLVDLLGFRDLGRFEKLAWSVPIDFRGKAFLIEHRKFGVGIFIQDDEDKEDAEAIALLLKRAVRAAKPFFKWKADDAIKASNFNVTNNSKRLFERYEYLKSLYEPKYAEAVQKKEETIKTEFKNGWLVERPYYNLIRDARWLALATIDAFFCWTEHVLVHIAILNSAIKTGEQFISISGGEWNTKFKAALDIEDPVTKRHFDKLMMLRKQIRNFVAHGAFGKDGETLLFHSSAGAVPVTFDTTKDGTAITVGENLEFDSAQAFEIIEPFIKYLWEGQREPAFIYIQEWELPLILTFARDGKYQEAMSSVEDMNLLVEHLSHEIDNASNMDW